MVAPSPAHLAPHATCLSRPAWMRHPRFHIAIFASITDRLPRQPSRVSCEVKFSKDFFFVYVGIEVQPLHCSLPDLLLKACSECRVSATFFEAV